MPDRKITTKDVYDAISKLYVLITGNGDPEKGILFREAMVERRLESLCSQVNLVSAKVDTNRADFTAQFEVLENKLNDHVLKLNSHLDRVQDGFPKEKEVIWLDKFIPADVRDNIVKW